jgi:activating signal cointegrator complex subunit 2
VAQNTSLHDFLDSYLQFRHRWYDLPHRAPKGAVAGLVVGELELCRRVFMVLYRMWDFCHFSFSVQPFRLVAFVCYDLWYASFSCFRSSNKDPGAGRGESLSMKEHTGGISTHLFIVGFIEVLHWSKYTVFTIPLCSFVALLLEKKLLDLPKLLDICAIYEHDNNKLTSSLVSPWSSFMLFWLLCWQRSLTSCFARLRMLLMCSQMPWMALILSFPSSLAFSTQCMIGAWHLYR